MLKMSQVTSIREQWSEGKTIREIARAVSVDRNTVYKYTQMTDFSKAVALYVPRGCMLDKHRDEIIAMLKEERKEDGSMRLMRDHNGSCETSSDYRSSWRIGTDYDSL